MFQAKWSDNMVLEGIWQRQRDGKPLNFSAVVADDEPLSGAARRIFGSWSLRLVSIIKLSGKRHARTSSPPADNPSLAVSNTQGIAVTQDLKGLYTLYEFEVNKDKHSRLKWKITGTKTVQGERKYVNETVKDFFTKNPNPNPDDEKQPPLQSPTSEYETTVQASP